VIVWIGIVLFVSTNVDDLFVLIAFFADSSFRAREVVLGQYLGMSALIGISLLGALGATVIPLHYVRFLGAVPIALGVKKLIDLRKRGDDERRDDRLAAFRPLAVAATTIGNGADNVGAYVPLFATRTRFEVGLLASMFLALTGLWCLAAYRLVHHPRTGAPIRRSARVVVPFVLVALGIYILHP
jgi:cadmium resistance protein CadD (predicted permease)